MTKGARQDHGKGGSFDNLGSACLRGILTILLLSAAGSGAPGWSRAPEDPTEEMLTAAPVTFWASQPVGPGETVVVAGGNLSAKANAAVSRMADTDPGSPLVPVRWANLWQTVLPLQATVNSIKFVLPKGDPGVYAYRLHVPDAIGAVTLVNTPDVWFYQGDHGATASPGGRLGLFGTGLAIAGGPSSYRPRIALVRNGVVAATVLAEPQVPAEAPFGAWFNLPASLAPGAYTLYCHNGHGGQPAWTRYSSFGHGAAFNSAFATLDTVTVAVPIPGPSAVYPLGPPKGKGAADDAAFTAAFQFSQAQGGAVILLSSGTYTLSAAYVQGFGNVMPPHTILRGAGMDGAQATVLSFPSMDGASDAIMAGLPRYQPYPPGTGTGDQFTMGQFGVENLAISAPKMAGGIAIDFNAQALGDAGWSCHVDRVKLTMGPLPNSTIGVLFSTTANGRVTNCDITAGIPVAVNNRCFATRIQGNTLTWCQQGIVAGHRIQNTVITGNTLILPDLTSAGVGLGFPAVSKDVYCAGNTTRQLGKVGFWGMTFDEGNGIYFGYASSALGTTLTLAKAVTNLSYMPPMGDSVMILAGTGAGQMRYVVANPTPTTLTLDRPFAVPPDSSSVVSVCVTIGRMLFVNNIYGADADDNAFFPSADVIQANNTMTGPSNLLVQQTGQYMTANGIMPGWHFQLLGNTISAGTGQLQSQAGFGMGDATAWYTPSVTQTSIFRNNTFAPAVGGEISFSGRISNGLIERNKAPSFKIDGPSIEDTLVRGNLSNAGGPPSIRNDSPGTRVVP